jgi:membrane protein
MSMTREAGMWANVKALVMDIYRIWIGERPGPLAASLAYYAIFSIVPITYVAVVIAGIFVTTSQILVRLLEQLEELMGPEAVVQFIGAVNALAESTTRGSTLGTVISFIVLLFSASLIFFQLQYVLNNVWKAPAPTRGETSNYATLFGSHIEPKESSGSPNIVD